jgi:pyruvate formate lyase activating enzyme
VIIGGVQWTTLLDYPERIAATLFTAGCNFRCPFCHNPELVLPELVSNASKRLDDAFFAQLEDRMGFLDGVVISGGEPALQADLVVILERIKRLGFLIKLDTNGSQPDVILDVLERGLVDFIAMDVKAPVNSYDHLAGVAVDVSAIKRSMSLIMRLADDYEFRTTAAPGLSMADLLEIGTWLDGAGAYWLQEFQAPACKALVDMRCTEQPVLTTNDLEAVWLKLRDRFPIGGVRC